MIFGGEGGDFEAMEVEEVEDGGGRWDRIGFGDGEEETVESWEAEHSSESWVVCWCDTEKEGSHLQGFFHVGGEGEESIRDVGHDDWGGFHFCEQGDSSEEGSNDLEGFRGSESGGWREELVEGGEEEVGSDGSFCVGLEVEEDLVPPILLDEELLPRVRVHEDSLLERASDEVMLASRCG